MDCKHCGKETGTRSKSFCSIECMRRVKHPENFKHCYICHKEIYVNSRSGSLVCSQKCNGEHKRRERYKEIKPQILEGIALGMTMKDIVHDYGTRLCIIRDVCKDEGIDYDGIKRGEDIKRGEGFAQKIRAIEKERSKTERMLLSKVLIDSRRGMPLSESYEKHSGKCGDHVHCLIIKHCKCYRRISKNRRKNSNVVRKDRNAGYNSSIFKKESDFIKYLANQLGGECEVMLKNGRAKKCDVVATVGGIKYAIECKTDCRSTRLDAAIGQAMVSAWALGAHPAIGVPSDCGLDPMTKEYCEQAGIRIFRDDSQLPITFDQDRYKPASKALCEDFWNGMFGVWSAIRGTEDVNPKTMQELGFSKKQISSILGKPLDEL
jgi:hypothetical protein